MGWISKLGSVVLLGALLCTAPPAHVLHVHVKGLRDHGYNGRKSGIGVGVGVGALRQGPASPAARSSSTQSLLSSRTIAILPPKYALSTPLTCASALRMPCSVTSWWFMPASVCCSSPICAHKGSTHSTSAQGHAAAAEVSKAASPLSPLPFPTWLATMP